MGPKPYRSRSFPVTLCPRELGQPDGVRKLLKGELRLRVFGDQVATGFLDAEEREVDVVVNHRADERVVFREAVLVDRDLQRS